MFRVNSECVHSVLRVCSEFVQSVFRVSSGCVQSVLRVSSECVQSVCRVCSEFVHSLFRVCLILKSFHHLVHLVCRFLAFFCQIQLSMCSTPLQCKKKQFSTKASGASLTVKFLRYEVEKVLRAVYTKVRVVVSFFRK